MYVNLVVNERSKWHRSAAQCVFDDGLNPVSPSRHVWGKCSDSRYCIVGVSCTALVSCQTFTWPTACQSLSVRGTAADIGATHDVSGYLGDQITWRTRRPEGGGVSSSYLMPVKVDPCVAMLKPACLCTYCYISAASASCWFGNHWSSMT